MRGPRQPPIYGIRPTYPLMIQPGPVLVPPLPGVRWDGVELAVPFNAYGVTTRLLTEAGNPPAQVRIVDGTIPPQATDIEAVIDNPVLKPRAQEMLRQTPYQPSNILFASNREGSHSWLSGGAGKTLISLAAATRSLGNDKILFVTRGGARRHICSQIRTHTNLEPYMCSSENPTKEQFDAAREAQILVVGWEILPGWRNFLAKEIRCRRLVLDEIHRGGGHKRHEGVIKEDGKTKFNDLENQVAAAAEISRAAQWRMGLTATAIRDRVRGLWGQLDLVEPGHWGNYWKEYAVAHCDLREGAFGKDDSSNSNIPILRDRLSGIVFYVPHEVTHRDLPPTRYENVTLAPEEQTRTAAFAADMKKAQKEGSNEKVLQTLLELAASKKHGYAIETVCEAMEWGQKVVIFSGRRNDTYRLGDAIKQVLWGPRSKFGADKKPGIWVGTGGEDEKERHQMVTEYMAHPGPCVLVGTGYAFGESVDLQDTDLALMVMLPWTPGDLEQWTLRFSRQGQRRPCLIRFVIASRTADERVANALLNKLPTVVDVTGSHRGTQLADVIQGVKGNEAKILDGLAKMLAKDPTAEFDDIPGIV